jgi:hypothetical protein
MGIPEFTRGGSKAFVAGSRRNYAVGFGSGPTGQAIALPARSGSAGSPLCGGAPWLLLRPCLVHFNNYFLRKILKHQILQHTEYIIYRALNIYENKN